MIKYKMLIVIFSLLAVTGQSEKEKVVLIFDKSKMTLKNDRFTIDKQIFKFLPQQSKKCHIKYDDIERNVSTIADMNLKVRRSKKFDNKKDEAFYYSELFDIYIYVPDDKSSGLLYSVERIWVVEGKIIN